MEYIDVLWLHELADSPVRLVSELDAQRYETRKLEFFRSGAVGFANERQASSGTELGQMEVPPLAEINQDPEFRGTLIDESVFEALWRLHVPAADD
ncbi:hypothetical protein LRH25_09090 [Ideonella azotifigens]|uniref:DUF6881 domain-containing protein n=1 Tax=Ideonella azotifigens TaxID=513160 RepID=A0ABN1KFR6_9BURK|nr:hypothetical protein [Ideonella azotifigens]MCD2340497.1 hypothetical protein [Ideonella azotifigens]